MHVDSWPVLSRLLDAALELAPADRPRWLENLAPEYEALRPRLRRLLLDGTSPHADAFLDTIPKVDHTAEPSPEDAEADGLAPTTIGPYQVLRKLGEGGMGAVWLAQRSDGMLKRPVALKLPRGVWPRRGLAERMARERDILATLNHANIARLYDAGLTDTGQPYLALEFVPGRRIDDYADGERLTVRERLQLFLQVARAVAHAHARLIVHRDLKPSNVLVTDAGEVKLLDFGIAKLLEDGGADTTITEAAGRPLTPDYASPEQIAGEPLSIVSDVYSLGVLLYELLTGGRPYTLRRDSRGALEEAILQSVPKRPSDAASDRLVRRTLRGDLDTIVLKALRKKPEERYDTINAFAEDVERYLQGHAVLARPDRIGYRLSKFVLRNRIAVSAAAVVVVVTLAGASLVTWQAQVAFTEKVRGNEIRDLLTTIVREASPYNDDGRALAAIDWLKRVRDSVSQRLGDRPDLRIALLNIMGSSLLTLQDTASAEAVLTQARDEAVRQLGRDHPESLRARTLLTGVHRFRGRTKELRAELDYLIPILSANRAAFAEDLSIALRNRAHLEADEGHYAEAERVAQEGVELALEQFGGRHQETAGAYLMLALVQLSSRDPDTALRTAEHAYRTALDVFRESPKHPRVIEGRMVYGRALGEAGRPREAVEELTRVVNDSAEVFGASSRKVGTYSTSLARFQLQIGEIEGALHSSRQALDIVGRVADPDSFRYALLVHSRGAALLAARRAAEALPDLTRATEILRRAVAPYHNVTRGYAADQALALAYLGRHDEAEQLIDEMTPRDPRPDDETAARLRHALGVSRRMRGAYQEALRIQRHALDSIDERATFDLVRMNILTEIGVNLVALAQPAVASAFLEDALALSRRSQTRTNPDRADILAALGRTKTATARLDRHR